MAEAATKVVDIPYCIASGAGDGSYSWAASQGIPGLLLERGGNGECPPEQVECYCRDIHNLMVHLGLLKEELYPRQTARQVFEQTSYLAADCSGFWYPAVHMSANKQGRSAGRNKGCLWNGAATVFCCTRRHCFLSCRWPDCQTGLYQPGGLWTHLSREKAYGKSVRFLCKSMGGVNPPR